VQVRGNHEGSIRQRSDGKWEARIMLDGVSKSLYGRTRQDVASRLAAIIRDHDKGLPIIRDERQTVGRYLEEWIEGVRPQIEPSSWRRYDDCVRLHLIPELGGIKLTSLSAQHIQAMYARKMAAGLSGTTVRNLLHNTVHRALEDAEPMGLVQRNISKHVRAPKRSTQEMHPLTEKQSERFLEAAKGDRFYALYVLCLSTGMREGELLALHWQDIGRT
jgi:integrase